MTNLTPPSGMAGLATASYLYPAMPFPYYARMSRDDVEAIRAYLNTVTAVHHDVRASDQLPFPLNIRTAMTVWDRLYFKPGEFQAHTDKSEQWNRGAYLVLGPGHCAACHTPKTVLGGDETSKPLRGYALQGWFAPDITSGQGALADWSADDIVTYLRTGHNRHAAAAGLMGEVVDLSTSKMHDDDLKAIAVYLKDLSGSARPSSTTTADHDVLAAGGAIYQDLCSSCHAADGKGVPNMFPDLTETATVSASDPTTVLHVILRVPKALRRTGNRRALRCLHSAGSSTMDKSQPSPAISATASGKRRLASPSSRCRR